MKKKGRKSFQNSEPARKKRKLSNNENDGKGLLNNLHTTSKVARLIDALDDSSFISLVCFSFHPCSWEGEGRISYIIHNQSLTQPLFLQDDQEQNYLDKQTEFNNLLNNKSDVTTSKKKKEKKKNKGKSKKVSKEAEEEEELQISEEEEEYFPKAKTTEKKTNNSLKPTKSVLFGTGAKKEDGPRKKENTSNLLSFSPDDKNKPVRRPLEDAPTLIARRPLESAPTLIAPEPLGRSPMADTFGPTKQFTRF